MKSFIPVLVLILIFSLGFTISIFADDIRIQRTLNTGDANISMAQDKEGVLLIGTEGGGLLRYDGNGIKRVKINEDKKLFCIIPSVFVDSEGIIWVFVQRQGLFSYNKNSDLWKSYNPETTNSLTSDNVYWPSTLIAEDKESLLRMELNVDSRAILQDVFWKIKKVIYG